MLSWFMDICEVMLIVSICMVYLIASPAGSKLLQINYACNYRDCPCLCRIFCGYLAKIINIGKLLFY